MSLEIYWIEPTTGNNYKVLYNHSIAGNVSKMAYEAGLYNALWNPRNEYRCAKEIILVLEIGISNLKSNMSYYEQFEINKIWGSVIDLITFAELCLKTCIAFPNAELRSLISLATSSVFVASSHKSRCC